VLIVFWQVDQIKQLCALLNGKIFEQFGQLCEKIVGMKREFTLSAF
jgi:hypothetical protein